MPRDAATPAPDAAPTPECRAAGGRGPGQLAGVETLPASIAAR